MRKMILTKKSKKKQKNLEKWSKRFLVEKRLVSSAFIIGSQKPSSLKNAIFVF